MTRAYYNEIEPYCAQWLRNLIAAGHLPPGDVDDRSIRDVQPDDLRGYGQCHFFAGIGGFALACRMAGWPDARPIWTGGPPCQDNSVAAAVHGKRVGLRGDRSGLALDWLRLVNACTPPVVVFENVPGINPWIAEVTGSLARAGYDVSRSHATASGVGAPHRRRRVFLVADRNGPRLAQPRETGSSPFIGEPWRTAARDLWSEAPAGSGAMDHGVSVRVARLRAFGNAVVPQVAADIIKGLTHHTLTRTAV